MYGKIPKQILNCHIFYSKPDFISKIAYLDRQNIVSFKF